MKPPVPYYGGKATIADEIIAAFPAHDHYVEPYGGSLAVLLAKAPGRMETVNDLDLGLVTFWRVLRERRDDLMAVCELTPHARTEHLDAYLVEDGLDELEVARRVWVQADAGPRRDSPTNRVAPLHRPCRFGDVDAWLPVRLPVQDAAGGNASRVGQPRMSART